MTVIDAHQHFWQLNRFAYDWLDAEPLTPIRRDYLPEDLFRHLTDVGVDRSIFVQTQHNVEENRWILELCERHDFLAGMVGWVDLASADCESQLEEFRDNPQFVGVRHVTHDEPDDDFIVREDVLGGLRILQKHGVPFDLLFFPKHLPHAVTLARALPDLPMVIDHLAKPKIKTQQIDEWAADIRAAAKCPNIFCKISGMITEADWQAWDATQLQPYVDIVLEAFGPNRCMYGSDWPVCELAGSYRQVYEAARAVTAGLSDSEQADLFGGTATRFYGLG